MKKILTVALLFLFTGCFGNVSLANAFVNMENLESVTLHTRVDYYGEHEGFYYDYYEMYDWQKGLFKIYSFSEDKNILVERFSDNRGNIYSIDNDDLTLLDELVSLDSLDLRIYALSFMGASDSIFEQNFFVRNKYNATILSQDFFASEHEFFHKIGIVEMEVIVKGDYIESIVYNLVVDNELVFEATLTFSDYNQTVIDYPIKGDSRDQADVFYNTVNNLVKTIKQNHQTNTEIKYVIRDGKFIEGMIDYDGAMPQVGVIIVNQNNQVRLAVHDGKYCVNKAFGGSLQIKEAATSDCHLP